MESQITDLSIEISNRCLKEDFWEHSIYHLFMTAEKKKEVDTSYLLSILQGKDKQPVIPKIVDENGLEHCLLTDQTPLKLNSWGIPEPLSCIAIIAWTASTVGCCKRYVESIGDVPMTFKPYL